MNGGDLPDARHRRPDRVLAAGTPTPIILRPQSSLLDSGIKDVPGVVLLVRRAAAAPEARVENGQRLDLADIEEPPPDRVLARESAGPQLVDEQPIDPSLTPVIVWFDDSRLVVVTHLDEALLLNRRPNERIDRRWKIEHHSW